MRHISENLVFKQTSNIIFIWFSVIRATLPTTVRNCSPLPSLSLSEILKNKNYD